MANLTLNGQQGSETDPRAVNPSAICEISSQSPEILGVCLKLVAGPSPIFFGKKICPPCWILRRHFEGYHYNLTQNPHLITKAYKYSYTDIIYFSKVVSIQTIMI